MLRRGAGTDRPASTRRRLLAGLGAALLLPAAGRRAPAGRPHQVMIEGFAFAPARVAVGAGETVEWTNTDIVPHTATDRAGGWDTGTLARGEGAAVTFRTPGRFVYVCTFHPHMRGEVVVA